MKAIPPWVTYTVLRLLAIAVPLAILLPLLGMRFWWIAASASIVIGFCISYIFLKRPRERFAEDIAAVNERRKANRGDAEEDAEADALRAEAPDDDTAETATARARRRGILPDDD